MNSAAEVGGHGLDVGGDEGGALGDRDREVREPEVRLARRELGLERRDERIDDDWIGGAGVVDDQLGRRGV